jgi:hypothetical protein
VTIDLVTIDFVGRRRASVREPTVIRADGEAAA